MHSPRIKLWAATACLLFFVYIYIYMINLTLSKPWQIGYGCRQCSDGRSVCTYGDAGDHAYRRQLPQNWQDSKSSDFSYHNKVDVLNTNIQVTCLTTKHFR